MTYRFYAASVGMVLGVVVGIATLLGLLLTGLSLSDVLNTSVITMSAGMAIGAVGGLITPNLVVAIGAPVMWLWDYFA